MANADLRGEPDAGNPHVSVDEGEVASASADRLSVPRQLGGEALLAQARPPALTVLARNERVCEDLSLLKQVTRRLDAGPVFVGGDGGGDGTAL